MNIEALYILFILITIWCLSCAILTGRHVDFGAFTKDDSLPLRGLCALIVVCGHMVAYAQVTFGFLQYLSWETPAVGIFMFMSGFGTAKIYLKNLQKESTALEDSTLIRKKELLPHYFLHITQKLIIPLGLVMFFGAILLYMDGRFSPRFIARNYWRGSTILCNHSWYIFELYAFSIGFYIFAIYCQKKVWRLFFLISLYACLIFVVLRFVMQWSYYWYISIGAFPMGFLFAYREQYLRGYFLKHGVLGYVILTIISLGLFSVLILTKNEDYQIVTQAFIGIPVVMCSWVLPISKKVKCLYGLGSISYELYLTHGLTRKYLLKWGADILPNRNMLGVVIIVASFVFAIIFHFVLKYGQSFYGKKERL